jgi:hypothetical protein
MAAPPLPQSPANQQQQQQQQQAAASPQPGTPLSPGAQTREQQRVALLLELNTELLFDLNQNLAEGTVDNVPKAARQAEYVDVLRRIQSNLAYLMPAAQKDPSKPPKRPVFTSAPSHMPQLSTKYEQLGELFPEGS